MNTLCPLCGWPDKGDGCEHCRGLTAPDTSPPVAEAIAKLDNLVTADLPKPYAVLQAMVTAALQGYLKAVGAPGETTLEVIALHDGIAYAISRFSVDTHFDDPIVRKLP